MVQLKYFGDNRDYFKYDLITTLLKENVANNYVFTPMLTEHRDDNEGKSKAKLSEGKSLELLDFIIGCKTKSLDNWKTLISPIVKKYQTIEPVDQYYFTDSARNQYWENFRSKLKMQNALIFIDPDTGLETGTKSYMTKMGIDKYLLNDDLRTIYYDLDSTSIMMIYQHLLRNEKKRYEAIYKKVQQVKRVLNKGVFICGYREIDVAFIFICRDEAMKNALYDCLEKYSVKNNIQTKNLLSG
ncbi:MAG: hypothetical protein JW967_08610 [Dehalococcoidales bacterium]|nr:hypothetical protein [Dehalococcoidales bacterium]